VFNTLRTAEFGDIMPEFIVIITIGAWEFHSV